MEGIIEVLLEIEQKAESALAHVQREKDRLPARITTETEHIHKLIAQEMATAIHKLHEASEQSTAAHIHDIKRNSTRQLADLELQFSQRQETLRSRAFERLTKWTI